MGAIIEFVQNKQKKTNFIVLPDRIDDIELEDGKSLLITPEALVKLLENKLFIPAFFTVEASSFETLASVFNEPQILEFKKQVGTISPDTESPKWKSTRLTFYKKKIEELDPGAAFEVEVADIGTYKMTRSQFEEIFCNVVASYSYQELGVYSYSKTPKKAGQFLNS